MDPAYARTRSATESVQRAIFLQFTMVLRHGANNFRHTVNRIDPGVGPRSVRRPADSMASPSYDPVMRRNDVEARRLRYDRRVGWSRKQLCLRTGSSDASACFAGTVP